MGKFEKNCKAQEEYHNGIEEYVNILTLFKNKKLQNIY